VKGPSQSAVGVIISVEVLVMVGVSDGRIVSVAVFVDVILGVGVGEGDDVDEAVAVSVFVALGMIDFATGRDMTSQAAAKMIARIRLSIQNPVINLFQPFNVGAGIYPNSNMIRRNPSSAIFTAHLQAFLGCPP
jgi:hypothetical protein